MLWSMVTKQQYVNLAYEMNQEVLQKDRGIQFQNLRDILAIEIISLSRESALIVARLDIKSGNARMKLPTRLGRKKII